MVNKFAGSKFEHQVYVWEPLDMSGSDYWLLTTDYLPGCLSYNVTSLTQNSRHTWHLTRHVTGLRTGFLLPNIRTRGSEFLIALIISVQMFTGVDLWMWRLSGRSHVCRHLLQYQNSLRPMKTDGSTRSGKISRF